MERKYSIAVCEKQKAKLQVDDKKKNLFVEGRDLSERIKRKRFYLKKLEKISFSSSWKKKTRLKPSCGRWDDRLLKIRQR